MTRLRLLLIALAAVALATLIVTVWPAGTARDSFPGSTSLAVSLIARTNGNVILNVKNVGRQQFDMETYLEVEYFNPASPDDYCRTTAHQFTNTVFGLSPGAGFEICFPEPTNHLTWRANVGGYGQRQIAFKTGFCRTLKHFGLSRFAAFALRPEYGQTEWISYEH